MQGTQGAQFSTKVLRRGTAVVFPQQQPDRWLDALLEEADLFAPGEGDSEAGDSVAEGCAGLLGAVLVLISEQRGHPPEMEIAATTLLDYLNCYTLALAAASISRRTDIWVEPPTVENIFDTEREVRPGAAPRRALNVGPPHALRL